MPKMDSTTFSSIAWLTSRRRMAPCALLELTGGSAAAVLRPWTLLHHA